MSDVMWESFYKNAIWYRRHSIDQLVLAVDIILGVTTILKEDDWERLNIWSSKINYIAIPEIFKKRTESMMCAGLIIYK